MNWHIHPDGSFDVLGAGVALRGCYPALDGQPLHPLRVDVRRTAGAARARYTLAGAVLTLRFSRDARGLVLACSFAGPARAPHWIQPISHGRVEGANRFFRHGLGFSGPSGFANILDCKTTWSHDTYLTGALVAPDGRTLSIGALEHRRFLQKTTLHNRLVRSDFCNRRIVADVPLLDAGFATEGIALKTAGLHLPALHLVCAAQPWPALRTLAEAIARAGKARTQQPSCYHYCSWYQRASFYNESDLRALLDGLQRIKPRIPIQTIQIDDGHEICYGDWLEPAHGWPNGMQAAFERIAAHGYRAGVWIAPFMVGNRSRLFSEHPEWLLRDRSGALIAEWKHYDGTRINEEVYILDSSHPGAFAYLRRVFRMLRGWGATFYKTDFMDWGLKDSLLVKRHAPGKTSVEYFVEVLKMIREEIGEESYWLACISPYAPFIGFADGMRVANDVGPQWTAGGLGNMLNETVHSQYFNNLFWHNDPDVLYVRDCFTHLSDAETRSLAFWNGIMGGSVNTSDDFPTLPPERLALWRFLQPPRKAANARLPFWDEPRRLLVAVRDYPARRAAGVLVVNPCDERNTETFTMRDLVGADARHCFTWSPAGAAYVGKVEHLTVTLEPHASALFYLGAQRVAPPAQLTISGERNV